MWSVQILSRYTGDSKLAVGGNASVNSWLSLYFSAAMD